MNHTIVAGNSVNCGTGLGLLQSLGHNLDDDGSCPFTFVGDLSNVADAGLGPLADHGGPTETHALLPGSPAIDAGRAFDQRGVRLKDGNGDMRIVPDIGAHEQPPSGSGCGLGFELAFLLPPLMWLRGRRRLSVH